MQNPSRNETVASRRAVFAAAMALLLAAVATPDQPLDTLSVRGTSVVNTRGEVVPLHGINFGGWLMMETWIPSLELEMHDRLPELAKETGVSDAYVSAMKQLGEFNDDTTKASDYIAKVCAAVKESAEPEKYEAFARLVAKEPPLHAATDIDALLKHRFGDNGAAEIWNAFHDTWITETDFQLAKAAGFSFVRIPFWYRWFENESQPYTYNDYGFSYLDKAVKWATEQRIYVLLDMHGAPGGQSPWLHTGEISRGEFFQNEDFQKRAAALWRVIAERYKNEPVVWGYDLLNEPYSAKGVEDWSLAHDLLYKAIREVDPDTIVVMEDGYKLEDQPWKGKGFFPDPKTMGWTNVVYSFHFYSGADPEITTARGETTHATRLKEVLRVGSREQDRCHVPIYLGEFSTMGDSPNDIAGMRLFLDTFNKKGWAWSPWTWKYVNDDGIGSIWGVYQFLDPWPRTPNMHRDSKEEILSVIARTGTENFRIKDRYAEVIRACTAKPQ